MKKYLLPIILVSLGGVLLLASGLFKGSESETFEEKWRRILKESTPESVKNATRGRDSQGTTGTTRGRG